MFCDPNGLAIELKACTRSFINEHSDALAVAFECEIANLDARSECARLAACDEERSVACENDRKALPECEDLPTELSEAYRTACPATFPCDDGSVIALEDVCDGVEDCTNGEDERCSSE